MAYFNPKPLEFNPNSKVIEASGALGNALYEMYQNSLKNQREQEKIDEARRSNLANEEHNERKFDYTQKKDQRDFDFNTHKFNTEMGFKEREFNANQAHRASQRALGWANHNLRANALARADAQEREQRQREIEADRAQNMAYFDYGAKNGLFDSANFGELDDTQKAQIGANLKAQMNAQGQIYKANEPFFKMQKESEAKAKAEQETRAKNLQIVDIASSRAGEFGLDDNDLMAINEMKKRAQGGDSEALKDLENIGSQIGSQIATQKEINANLGIKPVTQAQKNAIAKLQTQQNLNETLLDRIDDTIRGDYARGGVDVNSGVLDKMIYSTPLKNWSDDASRKEAEINNISSAYANAQKGMGKFNYENATDRLTPSALGSKGAVEQTLAMRNKALDDLEIIANQMIEQGYKGGYDLLEKVQNQKISDNELRAMMYGKGQNLLSESKTAQPKKPSQADLRRKWGVSDDDFYENMDEYGGIYQ